MVKLGDSVADRLGENIIEVENRHNNNHLRMICEGIEIYVSGNGYVSVEFKGTKAFQIRLWDGSSHWMNHQGLISLNTYVRFGSGGMFLLYALFPLVNKIVNRISLEKQKIIMGIVAAVIDGLIDFGGVFMGRVMYEGISGLNPNKE